MACVAGRITLAELLANFAIVYVANFIGAVGLAGSSRFPVTRS